MVDLFPSAVAAGALAFVGLVLGFFLVPFAARRTLAQPLEMALEDEVTLLLGVLSDVSRLPYLTTIRPADFASGANARLWAAMLAVAQPELASLPDDPDDAQCQEVGERIARSAAAFHDQLQSVLSTGLSRVADGDRLAYLASLSAARQPSNEEVLEAAAAVLTTGTARNTLSGSGLLVPSDVPDSLDPVRPPLRRVLATATRLRQVVGATLLAAVLSVSYGFAATAGLTGVGLWLAVGGLTALAGGSLVIALVDLDTMYIDLRSFAVTVVLSWVLVAAALGVSGRWAGLFSGVVIVAATAVVFEVANRLYRWRRGVDGQGFGDTLILVLTVGVPPAIVGDWRLGFFSVMCAMTLALLGWVVGAVRGKLRANSPMAFGPYLAAGWVVGWFGYLLMGV